MSTDIKQFEKIFKNYNLHREKDIENEDNLFTLGLRNFYENPFTEVLAYILDSKCEYTHRLDFFNSFFSDILPMEVLESLISFSQTSIQCRTDKGKYIDLIVFNRDYVIVFENKIFHSADNPFDDYIAHVEQKYHSKKAYYILLSYKNQNPPEGWKFVSIPNQFDKIIKNIPNQFFNKWDYFVLDFLKHFSNKKLNMTDKEKDFYEKNFHKIIAANNNLEAYINDVMGRFADDNQARFVVSSKWNGETKAIRFFPIEGNESNVVLIFETDGRFKVSVYYYKDYSDSLKEIYDIVGVEKYEEWSEGRNPPICCFAIKQGNEYDLLNDALDECKNQIGNMKNYFN